MFMHSLQRRGAAIFSFRRHILFRKGGIRMTLYDLRQKEVINTLDGRSLGQVTDLVFCPCDGRISAIVTPGEFCLSGLLRPCRDRLERAIVIPWERICKIGDDVILVDLPPDGQVNPARPPHP